MATLTELRDERTTNNTDERVGTGLRSVGTRQTIPEEYDKSYSEAYGTTLTQSQLEALNKNQEDFNTSLTAAKEDTNTKREGVDKAVSSLPGIFSDYDTEDARKALYNKFSGEYGITPDSNSRRVPSVLGNPGTSVSSEDEEHLNARVTRTLQNEYISDLKNTSGFNDFYNNWIETNTVPVTIVNPNNPNNKTTYMVDKETAYNNIATIDFQGYGGVVKNSDGSLYVSSDRYGDSLQGQLATYSRDLYVGLGDLYVPAAKESVVEVYNSLSSRQEQINAYESENINALNTIRTTYSNKLSDIKDTINSLMQG